MQVQVKFKSQAHKCLKNTIKLVGWRKQQLLKVEMSLRKIKKKLTNNRVPQPLRILDLLGMKKMRSI